MTEIARTGVGKHLPPGHGGAHSSHVGYDTPSPEGAEIYSQKHNSVLTIVRLDNISNTSTGLRLWQAETNLSGLSWTDPHPFVLPQLHADNVSDGTHMAPGNGIELQYDTYLGIRLYAPHTPRILINLTGIYLRFYCVRKNMIIDTSWLEQIRALRWAPPRRADPRTT